MFRQEPDGTEPTVMDHLTTAISGALQWTGLGGEDPNLTEEPLSGAQHDLMSKMVAPTTEDDLEPCQVATRPDEKGANTIEFQKLSRAIDKAFDAMRLAETEVHNLETQLEKFYAEEREKVQGKVKARVTSLPPNIENQKKKIHKAEDVLQHRKFEHKKAVRARDLFLKESESPGSNHTVLFSGRVVDAPSPEGPGAPSPEGERSGLQDPFRMARRGSLTAMSPESPANRARRGSATDIPVHLLRRPSSRENTIPAGTIPPARYGRRPSLESIVVNPPALARRRSEENIAAGGWAPTGAPGTPGAQPIVHQRRLSSENIHAPQRSQTERVIHPTRGL